jgi:hypothetical protein
VIATVAVTARLVVGARLAVRASVPPGGEPFPPVDQDPDDIRREACDLLDQSDCVPTTNRPPPVDNSSGGGGGGGIDLSFLSLLLWLLLGAAVVAVIVLLVRRTDMWARLAGKRRADDDDNDEVDDDADEVIDDGAVFVDRSREPTDWRKEAEQHRAAGRIREALRCRYRALVGDLARRGLIDEIPGRTTGEHRRQVHEVTPAVAATFDSAAELFDGAWYGHYDVDEDDDDHFAALDAQVLAQTRESRR